MKAIILAAGRGSRLGAETKGLPKCLLDMGDRKLIDFQIESLIQSGVTDIVVVCGYEWQSVKEYLHRYRNINIRTVLNHEFETTNTAYSLYLALRETKEAFFLLNADVLFDAEVIRRLKNSPCSSAMAVERKPCGDEEVKVVLDANRITEIGKQIRPENAFGEFIGAAKFSAKTAAALMESLNQIVSSQGRKQDYFEAGIDRILDSDFIASVDITDLATIEIDFPEDLHTARNLILPKITLDADHTVPKVLFCVGRNLHLSFLEPIHDYMVENLQVNAAFYSPAHRVSTTMAPGEGLDEKEINRLKMKSRVVDNPMTYPADVAVVAEDSYYEVRHAKKIVNVGHGLISKGFYYNDSPFVKRHDMADLICVPGRWHQEILQQRVATRIENTGFIKSDSLFNCSEDQIKAFFQKYDLSDYKHIVLYAPTFNEELSSVPCIREKITGLCKNDTVVLVKLHGMTPQKWVHLYQMLSRKEKNLFLIDDTDMAPAMISAHVMVSDVSSIFVEFMHLDKPVVLYQNPGRNTYNHFNIEDIEYIAAEAATEVRTIEELKLAVEVALLKPGENSRKRREIARMLGCPYDGRSVERASKAIMDVHKKSLKPISDNIRFSIIVRWDNQPKKTDIEQLVNHVKEKNRGMDYEFIFMTPFEGMDANLVADPEIKLCIPEHKNRQRAFQDAVNSASGKYIAFIKPGVCLPDRWLKWMYLYFKHDKNTGAVKALSYKENYDAILQKYDADTRPETYPEVSEYFMYHLISNQIEADEINADNECIMFSKDAYSRSGGVSLDTEKPDYVKNIGQQMRGNGFKLWHAVEVFAYPQKRSVDNGNSTAASGSVKSIKSEYLDPKRYSPDDCDYTGCEEIKMLLEKAKQLKKQEMYHEAVEALCQAKGLLDRTEPGVGREDVVYLLKESKKNKINENYQKSIELLEEAKAKMAI